MSSTKNKLQQDIIFLQSKIESMELNLREYQPDQVLLKEIEFLHNEVKSVDDVMFSGVVRFLVF